MAWRCVQGRRADLFGGVRAWSVAWVIVLSFGMPVFAGERGVDALQRCWDPAALMVRDGERVPRKNVKAAHVPSPGAPHEAGVPVSTAWRGAIRRVKVRGGRKLLALTFDLCEQSNEVAGYDGAIIDYLRANQIKATFFAGGKWLLTHEERSQQLMADLLFEVGSHGWAHRNLKALSGQKLSDEIVFTQTAFEMVRDRLGARACLRGADREAFNRATQMRLFRFPFGTCDAKALKATGDAGLLAIQWDIATGDPVRGQSASRIAAIILQQAKPGSIILAHANGRGWNTSKALPLVLPKLKAQGYEFVTVSELLAAGEPEIVQACYDRRPGDTERWLVSHKRGKNDKARSGGSHGSFFGVFSE